MKSPTLLIGVIIGCMTFSNCTKDNTPLVENIFGKFQGEWEGT